MTSRREQNYDGDAVPSSPQSGKTGKDGTDEASPKPVFPYTSPEPCIEPGIEPGMETRFDTRVYPFWFNLLLLSLAIHQHLRFLPFVHSMLTSSRVVCVIEQLRHGR